MSELQIDKFSAFCNSMFCVMMRRAIQSRQLVMNESAVDAFVDYCVTEDTRHWSKHVERDDDLEYWVSRIPERKVKKRRVLHSFNITNFFFCV